VYILRRQTENKQTYTTYEVLTFSKGKRHMFNQGKNEEKGKHVRTVEAAMSVESGASESPSGRV
jgi:hypothetical protein